MLVVFLSLLFHPLILTLVPERTHSFAEQNVPNGSFVTKFFSIGNSFSVFSRMSVFFATLNYDHNKQTLRKLYTPLFAAISSLSLSLSLSPFWSDVYSRSSLLDFLLSREDRFAILRC